MTLRRVARWDVIITHYLFTLLDVRSESDTDGSGEVNLSMWLFELLSGACTSFYDYLVLRVTSSRVARSNVIITYYLVTLLDVTSESVTDGSGDVNLSIWLFELLSGACTSFWWWSRTESDTEERGEVNYMSLLQNIVSFAMSLLQNIVSFAEYRNVARYTSTFTSSLSSMLGRRVTPRGVAR